MPSPFSPSPYSPSPYSSAAAAYANQARAALDPREVEARALLVAAGRLEALKAALAEGTPVDVGAALLMNRHLWTIFTSEMAEDSNPLPLPIRNNVANIGLFVLKRTLEIQARPEPGLLDALIEINRSLAAGLLERAPAATLSE